jgi:CRP/FNR family transcriptional regulator
MRTVRSSHPGTVDLKNGADMDPDDSSPSEAGWLAAFPALDRLDPASRLALLKTARLLTLPAGTIAFRSGSACDTFVLVLAGSVRVQMLSETGREIVLYRVESGETCILSTACLMGRLDYPAEAIAETEVRAALIPQAAFLDLLGLSAAFREFVFSAYGRRLADLMAVVEEVAFRRVDLRLARFLVDRADASGGLSLSHQEVATELGTVREVVSRQLKEFERRGWITLDRRRILVRDAASLGRLAGA